MLESGIGRAAPRPWAMRMGNDAASIQPIRTVMRAVPAHQKKALRIIVACPLEFRAIKPRPDQASLPCERAKKGHFADVDAVCGGRIRVRRRKMENRHAEW